MRNILGLMISVLLLGYGLMRIGVGAALLAQTLEVVNFIDLANATAEVKTFLSEREHKQLVPFSLAGYYSYIMAMGFLLAAGGAGVVFFKRWGFILLGVYLAMHAALFINYQEINPKIALLLLQAVLLVALFYLRPPRVLAVNH